MKMIRMFYEPTKAIADNILYTIKCGAVCNAHAIGGSSMGHLGQLPPSPSSTGARY